MNIAIIYHDADYDGILSNEVCRFHLKRLNPEATIHSYGWDYGRPVPKVTQTDRSDWYDYDQIYIVDLSVDELMARRELRDKIVWIDHHKSAIEKWDRLAEIGDKPYPYFTGMRIDGVAACRLCWNWFHEGESHGAHVTKSTFVDREVSEPELIRLAGEYDIWDHRDPDAKALQFGLRSLEDNKLSDLIVKQFRNSGSEYDRGVAGFSLMEAIAKGRAIKSYCDKNNAEYAAKFAHTIKWEGLTFCALNIGQRGNSDLLLGGIKPEHDACFAWRWTGDAVLVSLYHIAGHEQHDLSAIATKYGGGGHRGACGFRMTLSQLETILKP